MRRCDAARKCGKALYMEPECSPLNHTPRPAATTRALGTPEPKEFLLRSGFVLAGLVCLLPVATPALALTLGAAYTLLLGNPWPRFGKVAGKALLQTCVVLLGFQLDFRQMLHAGASGWFVAAFSIAATMGLGWFAGRLLRLHGKASALISAGTAICGGSAIAAVGPAIGASEAEMTVALGTVFSLNAVALYIFPPLGHWLQLSPAQFGLWSGIAIHDISSVTGAATAFGGGALPVATAVKLSRTLWIVPVTLVAALVFRRRSQETAEGAIAARGKIRLPIPWFIGLFALASLARLHWPAVAQAAPTIGHLARIGLTATLFLIGAGLSRATLRAAGWKAFTQGICLWLFISSASLLVVRHWG
jgi:uncharacterized integral membrane protein (TIGR00698 family)